jgi:hypothetical protein
MKSNSQTTILHSYVKRKSQAASHLKLNPIVQSEIIPPCYFTERNNDNHHVFLVYILFYLDGVQLIQFIIKLMITTSGLSELQRRSLVVPDK